MQSELDYLIERNNLSLGEKSEIDMKQRIANLNKVIHVFRVTPHLLFSPHKLT